MTFVCVLVCNHKIFGAGLGVILQSYGGYMAGMVGSSGSGVFSSAISQSPVTDWLYYGKTDGSLPVCLKLSDG